MKRPGHVQNSKYFEGVGRRFTWAPQHIQHFSSQTYSSGWQLSHETPKINKTHVWINDIHTELTAIILKDKWRDFVEEKCLSSVSVNWYVQQILYVKIFIKLTLLRTGCFGATLPASTQCTHWKTFWKKKMFDDIISCWSNYIFLQPVNYDLFMTSSATFFWK